MSIMRGTHPPTVYSRFIKLFAKRRFKEEVSKMTAEIKPSDFEWLAHNKVPIASVMARMKRPVAPVRTDKVNPAVNYLRSLSTDDLIRLIAEVAPEHAKLLRRYPEFAKDLEGALKSLVQQPP